MMKFTEKKFNTTSAAVMVLRASGEIIWVNNAFVASVGYCLDDLKSATRWPFLAKDYEEQFLSYVRQAISGKLPQSFDTPIVCSDGATKSVRWNTLLINDQSRQETVAVLGITIESSEQKEVDLAARVKQFRLIFDDAIISILLIGEDKTILLMNKEFERVAGYSKSEVEGKISWPDLVADKEDLLRMKEYHRLRRIDPALAPEMYNARLRHRNGDIRDAELRVIMVPETIYSIVFLQDITEKRLAEKAIRESEEKYRTLVDNMQDTLYRCDPQGNITFVSPSGPRLLGLDSVEEMIGKNIANDYYFNPDERKLFLQNLKTDGKVTGYETTLKRKDGSPIHIVTNSQLLCDKDGNILGVEGIFSDVTKWKQSEAELKKLAAIVRHSSELVNLADLDGNMISQ